MKDGSWWQLDARHINDLQQQSIGNLVSRCKGAHFVDVRLRINGEWKIYQADWIKHMEVRPRPLLAVWRELLWRFRCRFSWIWRRRDVDNTGAQMMQEENRGVAPSHARATPTT